MRFLFLLLPFLYSCGTTPQNEKPSEPVTPLGIAVEAPVDVLATKESENGLFCKDDIYSEYLKSEYIKKNSFKKFSREISLEQKNFKSKGKKFKGATISTQFEMQAVFYARSRLLGLTPSYYGAIPTVSNPQVEFWIRFFKTTGRVHFLKWLVRGESMRPIVNPILKEEGLPPEFIYLAMVESGFNNLAKSRAKAVGPWQFMSGTAKNYSLKLDEWVDERRDPRKSTRAAAKYLRDLYDEFGDWYLAMAAYNAGSGRLRGAMRKAGTRDFWQLCKSPYLPFETKNYIPKVLAALILSSDPKAHGFDFIKSNDQEMPLTTIELSRPLLVEELAQELSVSEDLIRNWNPEIINSITPPSKTGGYSLRLSADLIEKLEAKVANLSELEIKVVNWQSVRKNNFLKKIAHDYSVSLADILTLNPHLKAKPAKNFKRFESNKVAMVLKLGT